MSKYFSSFHDIKGIEPVNGINIKSVHLNNVMLTWVELQANAILPEHSHPHEQITLVIEGKLELTIEGETKIMTKGDSAVVPSGAVHSAKTFNEKTIATDAWNPLRKDYVMEK